MAKLTFYGGVDEIGGNKILLEEGNTKIFLDFGMSFNSEGKFFEFPLLRPTNIDDLRKIDAIPEIEGLYKSAGIKVNYNVNGDFSVEGNPEERKIDAILLTHGHLDHSGYLGLIRPDIPVCSSSVTKKFLKLRSDINKNWAADVEQECFNTLEVNKEKQIGNNILVKRFDVDHSVVGASAFLIYTKDKKIVYSGDFRFHGYRQKETEYFMETIAKENIDILITEGTRLSRNEDTNVFETEEDVFSAACDFTKNEKGLVIYDASPADIDRVRTLVRVAKETGRTLVLDDKKAYFILYFNYNEQKKLIEDLPTIDDFYIYLWREKLKKTSKRYSAMSHAFMNPFVETFVHGRNGHQRILLSAQDTDEKHPRAIKIPDGNIVWGPIGREKILKNSEKYIIYTSNGPMTLLQLLPVNGKIKGTYIYGKAEPFNEEMEFSYDKLVNWIELAGLNMKYAHTSGHVSRKDLEEFIKNINPKCVVPVHTENADVFNEFCSKVSRPILKKTLEL